MVEYTQSLPLRKHQEAFHLQAQGEQGQELFSYLKEHEIPGPMAELP